MINRNQDSGRTLGEFHGTTHDRRTPVEKKAASHGVNLEQINKDDPGLAIRIIQFLTGQGRK